MAKYDARYIGELLSRTANENARMAGKARPGLPIIPEGNAVRAMGSRTVTVMAPAPYARVTSP